MAQALPASSEFHALRLAAQIAARLVRPIGHFDPSACAMPPLSSRSVTALAGHPSFRVPLNRAVAQALHVSAAAIQPACLERLRTSPRTRLAALLVSQPASPLGDAAIRVAAAIAHRPIVGLLLKADRERVRAALGETAFVIATQEAPLLHATLAEIDMGGAVPAVLDVPEPQAFRGHMLGIGLRALARFIDTIEPALGDVFRWRLPAFDGIGARSVLTESQCDHIVRLLRRRMDAWSPIIA